MAGPLESNIQLLNKSNLKVFLIAGQSNTLRGDPITAADQVADQAVFQPFYDLSQGIYFDQKGEPLNHPTPDLTKIGFAFEFAKTLVADDTSATVLLIPCGIGSTGFDNGDWIVGGSAYDEAIERCFIPMASLTNATFEAVLWMQGEQDAIIGMSEAIYANHLDTMIAAMRSAIPRAANSLFIVGEMSSDWISDDPVLRQPVQDALNDTPNRISRSAVVSSTGLTVHDGVHYDAASQKVFGGRFYDQYEIHI